MIIVHDTFICKPGNASKVAKMMKDMATEDKNKIRVMTDITGQFHRVVMVSEFKSLSDYDKAMEAYMNPTPKMKKAMEKFTNFNEMYVSGSREIFRVW